LFYFSWGAISVEDFFLRIGSLSEYNLRDSFWNENLKFYNNKKHWETHTHTILKQWEIIP
jgi:hypothetical protein